MLPVIWFCIVAVMVAMYVVLDGFDLGAGIVHLGVARTDRERRAVIKSIGPVWDGNEVWLITAGGATFAAFPQWYATLFSGFYLPLFLMLLALIFRGVAFEFRSKDENPRWRSFWDWAIFGGSLVPPILWGVAFSNFVTGVPINQEFIYVGGFFNLLNPYALLGGLVVLLGFVLHGAIFLTLKTEDELADRAEKIAKRVWLPALVLLVAYTIATYFTTDIVTKLGVNPGVVPIFSVLALAVSGWFIRNGRAGWAFTMTSISIVLSTLTMFLLLFPRVLISNLDPAFTLTIYNASSSPYTLRIMTIIALIFVPIVLVYQGWTYWVFRKRVSETKGHLEY